MGKKCSVHTLSRYHANERHCSDWRSDLRDVTFYTWGRYCRILFNFNVLSNATHQSLDHGPVQPLIAHKKLGPFVHPHDGGSRQILVEHLAHSAGERVRRALPEQMADVRTRHDFDLTAALPQPKGHLQVVAAPNVHLLVVAAHLEEVLAVNGEQTAGHGGRGERRNGVGLVRPKGLLVQQVPS